MGLVQVMSAVHLALKARLLPDRVVWAKLWGDHPQHSSGTLREDKRLEYRPTRVQVGWDGRGLTGGETGERETLRISYQHVEWKSREEEGNNTGVSTPS